MVKFANRLMGSSKNQTQGYQLVILAMQPIYCGFQYLVLFSGLKPAH